MKLFKKLFFASITVLAFASAFINPAFANTGAIFTTDVSCNGTNVNIFDDKASVYLDGGPHHLGSAGLVDGDYYVQVTDPSGSTILGKTLTASVHITNGSFDNCYQLSSILSTGSSGFTLPGYDDTSNVGGEYKVWASQDSSFTHGDVKTDNFKVKSTEGTITGLKWQDNNMDGIKQGSEPRLSNWTIQLWDSTHTNMIDSTTTDAQGFYEFDNVPLGTYQVCEVIPDNTWHPSAPTSSTPNCFTSVDVTNHNIAKNINFGNYQNATLTVIKHVINDNGGTAQASDFTMNVDGTDVSNTSFPGDENGVTVTLKPGQYSVTESGSTNYTETDSTDCKGTATSGQTLICTITNDDTAPTLKLHKIVINNNGGTKTSHDWTLTADGTNGFSDLGDSTTFHSVNANTAYALSESSVPGYLASDWSCDGGNLANGQITLALGDQVTCTITNDDIQPKFTLTKIVINDNGGTKQVSDFPLFVDQTSVVSGAQNGFDAGNYTVSETQQSGYQQTSITGDCDSNGNVTLNVGDDKSCTITNDDIAPTLTVIKHVNNIHGGNDVAGDFTLHVTSGGSDVTSNPSSPQPGSEIGTTYTLNAGTYNVGEDTHTGYFESGITGDCDHTTGDISLAIGDVKTCTITNSDIAPSITLIKSVINDNGGAAQPDDFGISVGGNGVVSGVTTQVDSNTPIALNEIGLSGYQFVSLTGDTKCPDVLGGTVTLDEGESVTCTITNDDIPPSLTLTKHVINDNGGTELPSAWTLTATGPTTISGPGGVESASGFSAGLYTLSESGPSGYSTTGWTCTGATLNSQNQIVLVNGQTATCDITNDDVPPHLTIIKHVINDDGGILSASDFTMHIVATNPSSNDFPGSETGVTITLNAGQYSADETSNNGYIETKSTDCSGTIALGQTKTCTITNNDTPHATRTLGFWQTHTTYTSTIFTGLSPLTIGTHSINSPAKLFAGFYASISKIATGSNRTKLDQARMQMLQQWLATKLNCQAFGCNPGTVTLLNNAAAAWATTNTNAILSYASQMDAYNNKNDNMTIPGNQGSATPSASQLLAAPALSFWNVLP